MIATKQRKPRQPKEPVDELAALEAEIAERRERKAVHDREARRHAETARQAKREQVHELGRGAAQDRVIERLRRRHERISQDRITNADPLTHTAIAWLQEAKAHANTHIDMDLGHDREHLGDLERRGVVPDADAVLPNQAPAETPRLAAALERRVKRGDFAETFRRQLDAALAAVREVQISMNGDTEDALRKILAELPERCECGFGFNLNIERAE
jgi:hypothetical protein